MNRKEKARVEDKPVRSSENTNVKFNKYFGKGNYKNDNKLFVKCKNNLLYKCPEEHRFQAAGKNERKQEKERERRKERKKERKNERKKEIKKERKKDKS